MSYVNPQHPMFRGWPLAEGPGIHADESDSALPDIEDKLPAAVAKDLERQSDTSWGARQNPGKKAAKKEVPVATQQSISEAAMLITGMWGPEQAAEHRRKGFLPIVRENPVMMKFGQRPDTFFDRMRSCRDKIVVLLESASKTYDQRGAKNRPWQTTFDDCLAAVEFVLSQENLSERSILGTTSRTEALRGSGKGEITNVLGVARWGVVAVKGNDKLPFAAYSEFPLATCIGAGACWKYCYSFKALRYPAAFRRLFLNTLANYADREFSILKASGGRIVPPGEYERRVQLSMQGSQEPGYRIWQGIVKSIVLNSTKEDRKKSPIFLRLFVDGDINYEDNIVEWMYICHEMDRDGQDVAGTGLNHVEVYGYSKCWQQFVNVDSFLRNESQAKFHKNGGWPKNYTVNMSDASVYAAEEFADIRTAMIGLPVSRGFFQVVDLKKYIKELSEACSRYGGCTSPNVAKMIAGTTETAGFPISEKRVNTLIAVNEIQNAADVVSLFPGLAEDVLAMKGSGPKLANRLREIAMRYYIHKLINDEEWGLSKKIREELIADQKQGGSDMDAETLSSAVDSQDAFLRELVGKQMASLDRFVAKEQKYGKQVTAVDREVESLASEIETRIKNILEARDEGKDVTKRVAKEQPFFAAYVGGNDIRPLVRSKFQAGLVKAEREIKKGRTERSEKLALHAAGEKEKLSEMILSEFFAEKSQVKKAVALVLHETYWALNLGGSCPLVCGNCSDNPADPASGAHRCASRLGRDHSTGLFWAKTIHIGLH